MLLARWKVLLVAALIAAAALFVVGVWIERAGGDTHSASTPVGETHTEGSSAGTAGAGEAGGEPAGTTEPAGGHADATVLGIDLEAPAFVALALAASLVLAAAVWWWDRRWVLGLVLLFALLFTVLDGAEVVHQADGGRVVVVLVAGVVALLHAAATGLAAWALRERSEAGPSV